MSKNKTDKESKQHYVSDFYIRKFTCDTIEERDKSKLRVYALNKNGKIEKKKTSNLCQIRGYNSTNKELEDFKLMKSEFESMKLQLEQSPNKTFKGTNQKVKDFINMEQLWQLILAQDAPTEIRFALWETEFSESINKIIESNQSLKDINNIKWLIIYFLSNQPNYRTALTRGTEESISIEDRIKGKGFLTELGMSPTFLLLSDWNHYIERIKPVDNKQFITSDNPVHIQYTVGSKFEGGWRLEYTDPPTIEGANLETTVTIPHDAIFFLPLNPLTGFYLYKNPNRREDIINTKDLIQKINISQIRQSKEYAFSRDELWLKLMYEESLDSNKG